MNIPLNKTTLNTDSSITIRKWMFDLQLSANDLLVFAVIHNYTEDDKTWFTGSINQLCALLNLTRPTIIKCLKNLVNLGLLYREQTEINGVLFPRYLRNADKILEILKESTTFAK